MSDPLGHWNEARIIEKLGDVVLLEVTGYLNVAACVFSFLDMHNDFMAAKWTILGTHGHRPHSNLVYIFLIERI